VRERHGLERQVRFERAVAHDYVVLVFSEQFLPRRLDLVFFRRGGFVRGLSRRLRFFFSNDFIRFLGFGFFLVFFSHCDNTFCRA
jgi:hypothetical protein